MRYLMAFLLSAAVALTACTPATTMMAPAHPAISAAQVRVLPAPPPGSQNIAELVASSKSVFQPGGLRAEDKVIAQLKDLAAKVGANAIVLENFDDRLSGSIGTGVGSTSYSHDSAVGVGVSGGMGIFKKTGHARALYVPPGSMPLELMPPASTAPPNAVPSDPPPSPPAPPPPT